MAIYKDVEPLELVLYESDNEEFDKGVLFILEKLDALPTADVVEIEILRDWLWEIALNNAGGDFSIACQDIISRLDGLRKFAQERK